MKTGSEENQSVRRALEVLELLSSSNEPVGVREVARKLGFAPSIAQRLLYTLTNAGFAEQKGDSSRYSIGYKCFQVGNKFLLQDNIPTIVTPELENLAEQDITGFLGVLRQATVVYLLSVQGNGPIAVKRQMGSVTYPHSTALGKALLAEYPDDVIAKLLPNPLPQLTPNTRISVDALLAELAEIRQQGYALNDQENRLNVFSIGAVIREAGGNAVGALSGAIPSIGLEPQKKDRIINLVLAAADRVSRRLGYQG